MGTLLLYGLLAVLVIAVLYGLAVLVLPKGEQIAPPAPDVPPWAGLPRGRMVAADIGAVRLPVALRGYRFAETDQLLDRLTDELQARDEEIARLHARAEVMPQAATTEQPWTGERWADERWTDES